MEKKQHPLDRLFREKLRNHEVPPGEAAWEKLRERLPQQTQRGVVQLRWGRWAIAASVAALIGAGVWFGQVSRTGINGPVLADAVTSPSAKPVRQSPSIATTPTESTGKEKTALGEMKGTQVEGEQLARYQSGKKSETLATVAAKFRRSTPELAPDRAERVNSTESTVPSDQSPAQHVAVIDKPTDQLKAAEATANVFVLHVTEPPILAEAVVQAPAAPTLEDVQTDKPKKGKFLNRMVKNLKHLKQGEWKEAGLDANGLLARAEEKLIHK